MNEFDSVSEMFSKESLLDTRKFMQSIMFWQRAEDFGIRKSRVLKDLKESRKQYVYSDLKSRKQQILNSFDNKCCICGFSLKPILQLHHIVPVRKFGGNDNGNVICVCPNCHKMLHVLYKAFDNDDDELIDSISESHDKETTKKINRILLGYINGMCEVYDIIKSL